MSSTTTLPLDALPPELWLRVFTFLDARSLHALNDVCTLFRAWVTESLALQLVIELEEAGLVPTYVSRAHTAAHVLEQVRRWQRSWLTLQPSHRATLEVPFVPGTLYELSGGYFFLSIDSGMHRPRTLAYTRLPAVEAEFYNDDDDGAQSPKWKRITVAEAIMDFAVDVDQDFLCFVELLTVQVIPSEGFLQRFRVHFRKMSDGKPHPAAKLPVIEYSISTPEPFGQCVVVIQVVGQHVVILFSGIMLFERRESIAVWDWTTGQIKGTVGRDDARTITTFVMLSPTQFLFPNRMTSILEVYAFDDDPVTSTSGTAPPALPLQAEFQLPQLLLDHAIFRSEPSPSAATTRRNRSFSVDPAQAIVSFTIQTIDDQNEPVIHTFISSRPAFVSRITAHHAAGHTGPLTVPWSEWNKDTRWDVWGRPPNWICHTIGQRYILLDDDGLDVPSAVRVAEFNPALVAKLEASAGQPDGNHATTEYTILTHSPNIPTGEGGNIVDSHGGLPCIEISTKEFFTFAGILIDEDRIVGLTTNAQSDITTLHVFLMGGEGTAPVDDDDDDDVSI